MRDWAKKVKRLGINWQLQNSGVDVKYGIGDVVSNIVITMHGDDYRGDHFVNHVVVSPLC